MKRHITHTAWTLGLMAAMTFGAGCESQQRQATHFGEPMQTEAPTVSAQQVLESPEQYDGQEVRLSGRVAQVCQRRGCWLTLTDGASSETVFVKFTCPIEGRLIPQAAVGREVVVAGTLQKTQISEAMARHLREDAGASQEEIEQIQGPQTLIRVASPSAQVFDLPPAATP